MDISLDSVDTDTQGIPRWALAPLRAFVFEQQRVGNLVHLSARGIGLIRTLPEVVDLINEAGPNPQGESLDRQPFQREAELAQEEVASGMRLLYSQAVVTMWANLEASIRALCSAWLQNKPETCQMGQVGRLRVRLCDYESLAAEERAAFVVGLLEQDIGAELKKGVGRFESVLEAIGLAGGATDAVRRGVLELSETRNLLVHRMGVADRRLVANCPWLDAKLGQPIQVGRPQFDRLSDAALSYVMELIQRLSVIFRQTRDADLDEFLAKLESRIQAPIAQAADAREPDLPE